MHSNNHKYVNFSWDSIDNVYIILILEIATKNNKKKQFVTKSFKQWTKVLLILKAFGMNSFSYKN